MIYRDRPEYAMKVLERGKGFRVFLDDTAQIIGPEIRIVHQNDERMALKLNAGVLVAEGYASTYGRSEREAKVAMEVLEKACYIYLAAEAIGGVKSLSPIEASLMRLVYKKKYSKNEEGDDRAETGRILGEDIDPVELRLREQLVEYGNKLVDEGLTAGTWGNLSVKLDDRYMLVTPSGIAYDRLTAADMVKVDIDTLEYEGELKPTSEKGLHADIYRGRQDVNAVIHTHQTHASVFAACERGMDDIYLAGYALPGTSKIAGNTVAALGENIGCIMAHHGMCAAGNTLEDAFSNCILIEEKAKEKLRK